MYDRFSRVADPDVHGISLDSWIRIHIRLKIPELWRLKLELWSAVDDQIGGVEAQNGAVVLDSHDFSNVRKPCNKLTFSNMFSP